MKAVFCLASNDEQACRIVDRLLAANFSNEDISILYPNQGTNTLHHPDGKSSRDQTFKSRDQTQTFRSNEYREEAGKEPVKQRNAKKSSLSTENTTKAPEGGVTGAVTGGVLGGSLGLLAGIGALAIPGLGPFIAAGPLMAALGGSGLGGGLGLLIGALVGSGIPEYEAAKYETGLKAGKILLSVQADSAEDVRRVEDIMKKEGATAISTSREPASSGY